MTRPIGPVSAALEADLRTSVRRRGIVLWLDLDAHYTELVDHLVAERQAARLPYAVHAFRGSYLELLQGLEKLAGGVDKTPLVVHLPGFTEETVKQSPMMELYAAGARYRKKLETAITEAAAGRVKPEAIAAFQQQGALTLGRADAWLAALLGEGPGSGLAAELGTMTPVAVMDDLLSGGLIAGRMRNPDDQDVVWDQLGAWTGLHAAWRDAALPPTSHRPSEVAFAIASWALAVEYVDDLQRPPADRRLTEMRALPKAVIEGCRKLAAHLRERHASFYQRTADETEGWLQDEVEVARAEDLGEIDTFRFEEEKVLEAALGALDTEDWGTVLSWAVARTDGRSFWVRDDPSRQAGWQLVHDAAVLGAAITAAGPALQATSLEGALERYREVGAAVDRAHRTLEQRRAALLHPQLPVFETLRARLDALRIVWRRWADDLAREFNKLCKKEGFLPPPSLQQRTLFEEVVRPMTQESGTTALFLVDALRYEMALELAQAVEGTPATTVVLRARLAELPTITSVGMNVLAPVADKGKLRPAVSERDILGFSSGEFRVCDPETRRRAMHHRVGGTKCPWLTLQEVVSRDATSLKRSVGGANLVVLHSEEIDRAGEKGIGVAVFDHVLQQLRTAWHLLREAGVRRFIVTADHGFLLLDETITDAVPHGRKIDPKRRHVLSTVAADHNGEVRVPLSELGYEGTELQLMFPASTAVFDTGRRPSGFVHGGNSLQERVIPVLTVVHRAPAGGDSLQYALQGGARDSVAGMHCIWGQVAVVAQGALSFGGTREVELGLRAIDDPAVQVELCQARGKARLGGGSVHVTVDEEFELFFKLTGLCDARVQVELYHPSTGALVAPLLLDSRFGVTALHRTTEPAPERSPEAVPRTSWLDSLPEGGVRQFFAHLTAHGVVTETEAASMLGGQRKVRQFSVQFEQYAARAPYGIRIDVVSGVKRYVREGSEK